MPDREKTALRIREMLMRDTWRDIDAYMPRYQHILNDALALLKEQEPEKEKITEYPCKNCCSPSERAACCGCEKERQWQTKYRKQEGR